MSELLNKQIDVLASRDCKVFIAKLTASNVWSLTVNLNGMIQADSKLLDIPVAQLVEEIEANVEDKSSENSDGEVWSGNLYAGTNNEFRIWIIRIDCMIRGVFCKSPNEL